MKKVMGAILLICLSLGMLTGCGAKSGETITSISQLDSTERRIGVAVGTADELLVAQRMPRAAVEYFNDTMAGYTSVAQGKLDAFVFDAYAMELAVQNGMKGVVILDETLGVSHEVAVGLSPKPRIPDLERKINAFLQELKADGTLDDMHNRWTHLQDYRMPDIDVPKTSDLHLVVGTSGTEMPYTFYQGTELWGKDIELARRFAAWLGATLELKVYDYSAIIPAAQTGDIDCIMANLFITEERAEAIRFSEPVSQEIVGVMVRDAKNAVAASADDDQGENSVSFWDSIVLSFEKTFIREDRYKLFLRGIGTTVLITVLSVLFGTVLGFLAYLLFHGGHRIADAVTRFCVWLVQGMPVVVLLMILYYVIFGRLSVSGTVVAVIGFTLLFGAAVYQMLKAAVNAVDPVQAEAARALGYPDRKSFFKIILPQALPHFMPAYKGEITGLIKATAVVGYIAVQDLTKIGDIVRSRTFEAFFPLIAVAIIYFVLAAILTMLVRQIEIGVDPKRRKPEKILKGVKTDD